MLRHGRAVARLLPDDLILFAPVDAAAPDCVPEHSKHSGSADEKSRMISHSSIANFVGSAGNRLGTAISFCGLF